MAIERVGRVLLYILPLASALRRHKKKIVRRYLHRTVRSSFCFDVSGHAKQCNFSSVVLKMNNDQEESVSTVVHKYDTSTNAAFFLNLPNSIAKGINVGKFIIKSFSSKQF